MSKVSWTTEQQQVIDLRNRNILVSAAAGSGKTAVLVERIITMISDDDNPVDIDRLLIVTFTNAAASEMRERISQAIEKKVEEMPDNTHLQKQLTLIHSAQITTIHSFCLNVIRNHFNTIDLDPSFRVASEAELKLLKSDIMEKMLEEDYEEGEEDFLRFTECYSVGKTDKGIEDMIFNLYNFSMSYPWPEKWLEQLRQNFNIDSKEVLNSTSWLKDLKEYINVLIKELLSKNDEAIGLCHVTGGPYYYEDALKSDYDMLLTLYGVEDFEELGERFINVSFTRLSNKRDESVEESLKNQVKAIRDSIKKSISDIVKNYFYQSMDDMVLDLQGVKPYMNTLISLALQFANCYKDAKREKNLVDFNDLEHFALNILVNLDEDEKVVPTLVAKELKDYYYEILIDEYQDSNLVQETLLTSISKVDMGQPNMFMVGDVKQSIYKFRLARPELFMEKYQTYSKEEGSFQKIDLHKNFRSRRTVLDTTNYIFNNIMKKDLGNVEYDHEAALNLGASFKETELSYASNSEIILVDCDVTVSEEEVDKKELEARAIAKRIRELIHEEDGIHVLDKTTGDYRKAGLNDIVILLRTMSGWADRFVEILMSEGINAYSDTQTGYFSTIEIKTVLNLLQIIDNPKQDIPLTATLHSPMFHVSSNELALIRSMHTNIDMYEGIELYIEKGEDIALVEKLKSFLSKLQSYREKEAYLNIHELLLFILEDTGYYHFVQAMPGGEQRIGNIDMLIEKAVEYENSSYLGLFNFIRYIEKLNKFDVDFGEASTISENDDTVRIMSIHKSKGLEFPIVFVAGMAKPFNNQDSRSRVVIHPDLGIGPDFIDIDKRVKVPTLLKKVIQQNIVLENLGEELRVLYVALTRAKEKLIMIGAVNDLDKKLEKWNQVYQMSGNGFPFSQRSQAGNYLDWIIPTLMSSDGLTNIKELPLTVTIESLDTITYEEVEKQMMNEIKKQELLQFDCEKTYSEEMKEAMEKQLEFIYPFATNNDIHSKMTVSEIKKLSMKEEEELSFEVFTQREEEKPLPKFMQGEIVKGTDRGTIYHKVMECLDYTNIHNKDDIITELERLVLEGKIKEEDKKVVNLKKLESFVHNPLCERMRRSIESNTFYTEQPFVLGVKADEIMPEINCYEVILVQGVIDVFFQEDNELVLLDYKTDKVTVEDGESLLVNRYKAQLDYYQKALEQLTGKKVKERIIYSFGLEKAIGL